MPPVCTESMISARPVTPASGMPPAMPFAESTMSGSQPNSDDANVAPVREMPDCTSSAIITTPCSVHHSCIAGR